jgi:hypothetical protein
MDLALTPSFRKGKDAPPPKGEGTEGGRMAMRPYMSMAEGG